MAKFTYFKNFRKEELHVHNEHFKDKNYFKPI